MRCRTGCLLLTVILCAASCGSSQSLTTVSEYGSQNAGPNTTTSTTTTLNNEIDWTIFKSNLNDRSTPIGTLCWLVWEVYRQNILLFERVIVSIEQDQNKSFKGPNDLIIGQDVYEAINKTVSFKDLTTDKLPTDIVPYAKEFYSSLQDNLNGNNSTNPYVIMLEETDKTQEVLKTLLSSPGCVLPLE